MGTVHPRSRGPIIPTTHHWPANHCYSEAASKQSSLHPAETKSNCTLAKDNEAKDKAEDREAEDNTDSHVLDIQQLNKRPRVSHHYQCMTLSPVSALRGNSLEELRWEQMQQDW